MRTLLVSPYHGGSHQAWAEGYQRNSAHTVDLLTLPARFWKWRMHGGAVTLARLYRNDLSAGALPHDVIVATDMLDLTTFLALTRPYTTQARTVMYMHENQLTYPLPTDPRKGAMRRQMGERDRHYAFINLVSMLAADRVYFNSLFHREQFFAALRPFLRHYPEYTELEMVESLHDRCAVLPVGIDLARLKSGVADTPAPEQLPLILWNQRLEYDKNPELFVNVLHTLADEGLTFNVALCGQRFGLPDPSLSESIAALGRRVIHNGYADESRYRQLLAQAAITCSTAHHEYFGISMIEAIYACTFPILPNRLSYPEVIPEAFHNPCLYRNRSELLEKLRWAINNPRAARVIAVELARNMIAYDWRSLAPRYDEAFSRS